MDMHFINTFILLLLLLYYYYYSPGVHYLRDPRTQKLNFPTTLEYITQPHDFDYDTLTPYTTSSRDTVNSFFLLYLYIYIYIYHGNQLTISFINGITLNI